MTEPGRPLREKGSAESDDARQARRLGKYAGLGFQFVASILLFLYVGRWLDGRMGTEPWGLVIGVFVGAGAAFYSMYRALMADLRRDEAQRTNAGGR